MTIFMILLGGFKGFLWTNRCGGNVYVYLVKNRGNIFSSERWKWLSWAYVASMGLPGAAPVDRGRFKPSKTPVFISQTDVTLQSLTFGNRSTLEGQKEQRLWKPCPFFLLFKFLKGLTIFFLLPFFCETKLYTFYLAIYLLLLSVIIIRGILLLRYFLLEVWQLLGTHYFLHTLHYCSTSIPSLSEMFWLSSWPCGLWLAKHLKRVGNVTTLTNIVSISFQGF